MNASGLAAVMNAGEICVDPPHVKGKKTTQNILRVILESCDSAAQAVEHESTTALKRCVKILKMLRRADYGKRLH
jgi:16S rRNA G966 N2-methylase RsmD